MELNGSRKKILITVSGGFVARNILRTGVLARLRQTHEMLLLCYREREDYYRKEFGDGGVRVVGVDFFAETAGEKLMRVLARNVLWTETVLSNQKERLIAAGNFSGLLLFYIKRGITFIGFIPGMLSLLRWGERLLVPPPRPIESLLTRERPALIFATNVVDDLDVRVLSAARHLGIRTVGMVKSWDNLTGHGMVRVAPEMFVVHSPWLLELAVGLQGISRKRVRVVGIPQYDSFFRKDFIRPRAEFLQSLGIAADRRLIIFAAIGTDFAPYEWEIPDMIDRAIERGALPGNCVVVARPHPNLGIPAGRRPVGRHIVFDQPTQYLSGSSLTWEMEKSDMDHFANLLYYADVVVTGASTITMDAAVLDRPIINYAFDGAHVLPYDQSVRRCYERYTHYIAMTKTGGARIVYSEEEMHEWIKKYLENPSFDREGRKRVVKEFVYYADGGSAERLAQEILAAMP